MTNFQDLKEEARRQFQELHSGSKPWIRIGAAVCGEAAGATAVSEAIKDTLTKAGIEANVSFVGCIGLCYAEPLIDIVKPGGSRIFYGNVTPEIASDLIRSYLSDENDHMPELALAYSGDDEVPGVAKLEDLPIWSHQVRIALRNCGMIEPMYIYQYKANGGYGALHKAITGMQPG